MALSEHDAKVLLAGHGLPVSAEVVVDTPDQAAAAANQIGFPVVVKLCGADILHKTELGAVRLGLRDAAAVQAAATELLALAPPGSSPSLLVAEQVKGNRELIAGVATDPAFGPTLMLGVGGIMAEALADVVFRLLPVDEAEIATMLDDLASQRLLGPFRGEPPVDRDAVARAVAAVARCAMADPCITAIDVNPMIITDGRPVAVDALVVFSTEPSDA